ncbi:hypothetical protein AVEN_156479-1 [Araneus ventricosus]|uniref:Uncharacterized protein n=1 Tax=Araneus ventricosus TaxID=182803 RepID=A0A4Y2V053_ARAVE|nr:hypothetical protein AVEN_13214-1 [Araneus ventricosus]GBO18573.1 hypothetical protein AVEN_156479-1 [Araneus ventricosus]
MEPDHASSRTGNETLMGQSISLFSKRQNRFPRSKIPAVQSMTPLIQSADPPAINSIINLSKENLILASLRLRSNDVQSKIIEFSQSALFFHDSSSLTYGNLRKYRIY